jgi:hypothetical protein
MLNFEIKKLDNWLIDATEIQNYLLEVETKYPELRWDPSMSPEDKQDMEICINVSEVYGYAVQSRFKDVNKPHHPYPFSNIEGILDGDTFDAPTKLCFGFTERLLKKLPFIMGLGIVGNCPGLTVPLHVDDDYDTRGLMRLHIPILTNDKSIWFTETNTYHLDLAKAYIINALTPHGTNNGGDTYRTHFIFRIHKDHYDYITNEIIDLRP